MEHERLCREIARTLNVSHTQAWQYLQYLKIEKSIKFKEDDAYVVGVNKVTETITEIPNSPELVVTKTE